MQKEINKILKFINNNFDENEKAIIAVSGGLDSDVITRLTYKVLRKEQIKLFIVIQSNMEMSHLQNARELAKELKLTLIEISLQDIPYQIVSSVQEADNSEGFNKNGLLDTSRTKVALRTVVNSIYQDKGYKVIGTSNKTEIELGFFLPFGDGIAHLKPIAHLYKSDVFKIAKELGTNKKVLEQPPSAGLWIGEKDLEDISYWIYNETPIQKEINFSENDIQKVEKIYAELSIKKLDLALSLLSDKRKLMDIALLTSFNLSTVKKLKKLVKNSKNFKLKPINRMIYD